jgi:anti-sigma-K factor RskA
MNEHILDEQLHDYAAGTLAADALAGVERHLAVCATCRTQVDSVKELLADLAALRGPIEPPRDLRPDIWRAIDAQVAETGRDQVLQLRPRLGPRTLFSTRAWLAAAAVLLVLVTSMLTWQVASRRGRAPATAALPVAAEYLAVTARYVSATDELEQFLAEQRAALSPETVRILDETLRVIDRALAESREAIEADPGNADLSRLLIATYEKKLGVLRSATREQAGI